MLRWDIDTALIPFQRKIAHHNTKSWQLTKSLHIATRILHACFFCQKLRTFLQSVKNFSRYLKEKNLIGLKNRIISITKNLYLSKLRKKRIKKQKNISWCIMTTQHTLFIGALIADKLREHQWDCTILTETPPYFNHDFYIVLCPQMFSKLPPGKKRIVFQLEQSVSSRWFTPKYLSILDHSLAVLDYSLKNIAFLKKNNIAYPHVFYLPIGAKRISNKNSEYIKKDIDVLFYGDSKSSKRRRHLLDELSKKFSVVIANEVFGDKMHKLIQRAKVVINIHYYENALLEMPRIQECLSLGTLVVSEKAQDQNEYPELDGAVIFFNESSVSDMLKAVQYALDKYPLADRIDYSIKQSEKKFTFMMNRFLLAMDFLPPSSCKDIKIPLTKKEHDIGLSLPETIDRRKFFQTIQPDNCEIFDGIRKSPGWIGCGLSYKVLASHALKYNWSSITIMEDDVLLPQDYGEKLKIIKKFLQHHAGQWDLFSGLIAILHEDTKIISIDIFEGMTFVTIDRMTSMVFNIYSSDFLKILMDWNPENQNSTTNTIDKFIESRTNLRVVVTYPFLVGHREEAHSTLWGFQNTTYNNLINKSLKDLHQKIQIYQTTEHNREK